MTVALDGGSDAPESEADATRTPSSTPPTTRIEVGGVVVSVPKPSSVPGATSSATSASGIERPSSAADNPGADVDTASGTPSPTRRTTPDTTTAPPSTSPSPTPTSTAAPTTTTVHNPWDHTGMVHTVTPTAFTLAPGERGTIIVTRTNTSTWTMTIGTGLCLRIDRPDETEYCAPGSVLGTLAPGATYTNELPFVAPRVPGTYPMLISTLVYVRDLATLTLQVVG
ncbi:MAG TPA: hypothetical protein VFZ83_08820 [Acidimicrobiia bacterium]|nr:hypothetical protein [Acidimicrobiia bacterium]